MQANEAKQEVEVKEEKAPTSDQIKEKRRKV